MKSNRNISMDLAPVVWMLGATVLAALALDSLAGPKSLAAGASAAQTAAPSDIDASSGFRLPLLKREALDEEGRKIYDAVSDPSSPTLAGLRGPDGILLYDPKVARLNRELNLYLRNDAGLSGHVRELAILVTAREANNQFEWTSHEPRGLKEGIDPKIIDIVKYQKNTQGLPEADAVIIQFGRELFGKNHVSPDTFARALKLLGPHQLIDVVSLMGNYCFTAALLTAVDMQLPQGQKPLLPQP
jgi:4-carboxymuconolactone decarboxylase